ncbi:MFS transporter, partial [Thermophilibacter provencensis]|uniref:MFS transporter n=1 Tax=Thermophilibacter provencensis TaxID=1852386 RepID=UPI003AA888F0
MHIDIRRQTRLYYAYVALSNLSMISVVMSLYLAHLGFSLYQIGILLGVLQVGNTVLEIPTGFVADRFGNRASLISALALQMAAYALMPLAGALPAMAAVMALLALANTLTTGCASAIGTNA